MQNSPDPDIIGSPLVTRTEYDGQSSTKKKKKKEEVQDIETDERTMHQRKVGLIHRRRRRR
jgi:hypothetical protein